MKQPRKQAKQHGRKVYIGTVCQACSHRKRYVKNRRCVACHKAEATNLVELRTMAMEGAQWAIDDLESQRAKARQRQAARRAKLRTTLLETFIQLTGVEL